MNRSFRHDVAHAARQLVFAIDALDRHAGRAAEAQPGGREKSKPYLVRMPLQKSLELAHGHTMPRRTQNVDELRPEPSRYGVEGAVDGPIG